MLEKSYKLCLIAISALALLGCKPHSPEHKAAGTEQTITVELKPSSTQLFYSGTLQPLRISSVTTPVDGTVKEMHFTYGQKVKAGQLIAVISSNKLEDSFRQALTDYLKAKNQSSQSQAKYSGSQMLYKAGIISQEEYEGDRGSYESDVLALLNARRQLQQSLQTFGLTWKQVENLRLEDIQQVQQILTQPRNQISLYADSAGVALLPTQQGTGTDDQSGGDQSGQITVGSSLKQGQVVVSIGDLSGLSVSFQVTETDVNRLKPGMDALVTGPAFPGVTLKGKIQSVGFEAAQAQGGFGGGLAMFPVVVVVPQLTPQEQRFIHVGMTAQVQISIANPPQIMVPIRAVFQKQGMSMVTVVDAKTKQRHDVPVQTGHTTMNEVVIQQGLKPGDQVVVPAS